MGTPNFAVPSLRLLVKSKHKIEAVVTQTDKPIGRKRQPCPPPVKEAALGYGIPIIQPENVNDENVVDQIAGYNPDVIITVAFGQKILSGLLNLPRYTCVNIHASLLPKYRGAAPISWAIIRGEESTGITSMVMREKMDAGEIILQKSLRIGDNETAGQLTDRLSNLGAELLIESLEQIDTGEAKYTKQDEKLVTYAPKLKKRDGLISWNQNSREVCNFVRGVNPWPGAYTTVSHNDKMERIIILETECGEIESPERSVENPGTVVGVLERGIKVLTKDGFVWITKVKPEGKREMQAVAFLRGHDIKIGDLFM